MTQNCNFCGKECMYCCIACADHFYCNKTCQRNDWKNHKLICNSEHAANARATIALGTALVDSDDPVSSKNVDSSDALTEGEYDLLDQARTISSKTNQVLLSESQSGSYSTSRSPDVFSDNLNGFPNQYEEYSNLSSAQSAQAIAMRGSSSVGPPPGFHQPFATVKPSTTQLAPLKRKDVNPFAHNPSIFSLFQTVAAGKDKKLPLMYLQSFAFSPRSDPDLQLPKEFATGGYIPEKITYQQADALINLLVKHITPGLATAQEKHLFDKISRRTSYASSSHGRSFNHVFQIHSHQALLEMLNALIAGYCIEPVIREFGETMENAFLLLSPKPGLTEYDEAMLKSVGKSINNVLFFIEFEYVAAESGESARLVSIVYKSRNAKDSCSFTYPPREF